MVAAPTAPFHGLLSQVPTFVHTKPGSQLAMVLLGAVGAKERKSMLKSMKPHAKEMAGNEFGWMVLARVMDCVDDTVLVKSCIFAELFGKDGDAAATIAAGVLQENHVRRLLVYVLGGQSTKYFSPDLIAALNVRKEFLAETAKKDAVLRRQEHVAAFVPRCATVLEQSPKVVDALMRELSGCQFLFELIKQCPPVAKSVVRLLANPLVLAVPEEVVDQEATTTTTTAAVDEDASDDEMIEQEEEEDEDEDEEEKEQEHEADAMEEDDDNDEVEDGEDGVVDDDDVIMESGAVTELAVSQHYLDTAEKPTQQAKVHVLVDPVGTRFLKKYCQELAGFADAMADAALEHGIVAELTAAMLVVVPSDDDQQQDQQQQQQTSTPPPTTLPTGPLFVLVSILEHCQDAEKREAFARHVLATMKPLLTKDAQHKGLVCLRGVLLEQQQQQQQQASSKKSKK